VLFASESRRHGERQTDLVAHRLNQIEKRVFVVLKLSPESTSALAAQLADEKVRSKPIVQIEHDDLSASSIRRRARRRHSIMPTVGSRSRS